MRVRLALFGAWTAADAEPAGARLAAAINTVASSALGKLCGLDRPLAGPTVARTGEALVADLVIRTLPLFRGLHAATGADVDDIMRY